VNGAIKAVRKQQQSLDLPDDEMDSDYNSYLLDPTPSPDDLMETSETEDAIWKALGLLSAERRAVIVMRLYLEMSETEVAERLNIPVGTIKSRLHAAKQQLRNLLHAERSIRYER
jgi:RNA polymerase sigma-70 factor, ECF subfamily